MAPAAQVALVGSDSVFFYSYSAVEDAQLVLTATAPASSSRAPIWSRDGSRCLVVERETVQVLYHSGQLLSEIKSDGGPISAATFYMDGLAVLDGSKLRTYSGAGVPKATLGGHPLDKKESALAVNSDDTLIATAAGSSLVIHDCGSQTHRTLHAKPRAAYSVLSFAPNRRTLLAAGTVTGLLHLFDTSKLSAPLRTLSLSSLPHPPAITNLAFSAVGPLLVVSTATGQLHLVDTEKMKGVLSFDVAFDLEKGKMALGPDGRTALLLGPGTMQILDIKTRNVVKEVSVKGELHGIAFRPPPSKPKSLARSSSIKPSSILTESINRIRAAERGSSPDEEPHQKARARSPVAVRPLDEMEEVFSPPRGQLGQSGNLDLGQQDLPPSKADFAESIAREARTSTIRAPCLPSSGTPFNRLAQSSFASSPSPDLPSPEPNVLPPRRSRSSISLRATVGLSRSSSAASLRPTSFEQNLVNDSQLDETLGALTRGLKLPELEGSDGGHTRGAAGGPRSRPAARADGSEPPVPRSERVNVGKRKETKDVVVPGVQSGAASMVRDPFKASVLAHEDDRRHDKSADASGSLEQTLRKLLEEHLARSSRDIQNLHLELIRQTFAQKTEIASLKSLLGAEVQSLREENARLRQENEDLRKG